MRWLLLGLLLLPSVAEAVDLELVSRSPELEGLQVQRPVWAPGERPRLVHEASDRSRRSILRVVTFGTDPVVVPAARGSRLAALGVGSDRADAGAAWWDGAGFFFVRSASGSVSGHYWDGVLRDLANPAGRPVTMTPFDGGLLVTMEDADGLDLFRFGGTDLATAPVRLTRTREGVEHSVTPRGDGVVFIETTRERTRLQRFDGDAVVAIDLPVADELLALSALPDGRLLAWARRADRANHALLLIDLARTEVTTLITDGFLPPGLAPRPAVSPSGWIYYVRADADAGNPVVRLRLDGASETLTLATSGHQEVAVGSYPGPGGAVDWIAVVAVGDVDGDDVANHLFVGAVDGGTQ